MRRKTLLVCLVLLLLLSAGIASASPGCPECEDDALCGGCRDFYSVVSESLPEHTVSIGSWIVGGLAVLAFGWVLLHVLRGDRRRHVPLRARR